MNKLLAAIWRPISKGFRNSPSSDHPAILKGRDPIPSHYLLEIESFSELIKNSTTSTVSLFEAGGYTWEIHIVLNGNVEEGYISIFLQVCSISLPNGWEVNAIFNVFVYDQIQDKYVGFRDMKQKRFHQISNESGSSKFMDLKTFKNPSNGYLVDDCCIFGAEVFVLENKKCFVESFSMMPLPLETIKYSWTFDDFSNKQDDKFYKSDFFLSEHHKWRILLNPNHHSSGKSNISVGLELDTSSFARNWKLHVNCIFRIVSHNEFDDSESNAAIIFQWTPDKDTYDFQLHRFMTIFELQNPEMNYIVNDSLILEVEITEIGLYTPHDTYHS